jgi:proteasome lid subunit RPN8/RPN11
MIKQEIYEAIIRAFADNEPECGGILGAVPGGPITHFYFDKTGTSTPKSYTPDCEAINTMLQNEWASIGVQMVGVVHTHSNEGNFPSCGDLHYAVQILHATSLTELLLPIVTMNPIHIWPYNVQLVGKQPTVTSESLQIL